MGRKVGGITGISSAVNQNSAIRSGMFSLDDRNYFGGYWGKLRATGGTEIPAAQSGNNYKYHVFISSGTFTVLEGTDELEYLIIAGGGGGGPWPGNAGGAGGVRVSTPSSPLSAQKFTVFGPNNYVVTVGGGGGAASNGTDSYFGPPSPTLGITATGGGTGGASGGSGGGGGTGNFPPTSPPQGNPGNSSGVPGSTGAPGGALGSPGSAPSSTGSPGLSFPEFASPIIQQAIPTPSHPTWIPAVGIAGTYAGAGGGGGGNFGGPSTPGNIGGLGGGGNGYNTTPPQNAVNYTGSGGGGGGYQNPGGSPAFTVPGGSGGGGIVIIRYREI